MKTCKIGDICTGDGDHLIIIMEKNDYGKMYRLYLSYFEHGKKHRKLIDNHFSIPSAVHQAYQFIANHS